MVNLILDFCGRCGKFPDFHFSVCSTFMILLLILNLCVVVVCRRYGFGGFPNIL